MKSDNLVIGASFKSHRYSNIAIQRLRQHALPVKAIGLRSGEIIDVGIDVGQPSYETIDTILLYINPSRQPEYYDYINSLKPRRVIFNPGTENSELQNMLNENGVETLNACSLVMLASGEF